MILKLKATAILTSALLALMISISATAGQYTINDNHNEKAPSAVGIVLDLALLRPIYLAATGAGSAFFTATLPITSIAGSLDTVAEELVRTPGRATFTRCVGCTKLHVSPMKSQLQFGASVVISPDYRDRIKESYPGYDVSGGYGWQKLDLNYSHSLTERLYMNHRMSLAFNYLIVDGEKDETYFNALLLPAIGLRYQIEPIYFFALANYALPYTGKEQFDFSVDRPGFELGLGTHLGSKLYAELSYLKAPFEFNGKSDNFGGGYTLGFGAKF